MSPHPLHRLLDRSYAALRRALVARHSLRVVAALAVLIAAVVLLGTAVAGGEALAWTRAALAAILAVAVTVAALGRLRRESRSFDAWLEAIEQRFPDVRSWLRNALDLERHAPEHTSGALAEALRVETARRLERVPLADLTPRLEPRRPALALVAAVAALVLAALAWPARVERSWATLWDPGSAAPPVRLSVEPGSVRVTPGAALAVRARVWGTGAAPRIERDGGPAVAPVAEGIAPDGAHAWRFDLAMLTRPQTYRVRAGREASPRYAITLAGEAAPVSFEVEYRAPAYARLPVQRGTGTRGDLTALRGSVATVTVTFDRDLTGLAVATPDGAHPAWSALTPRRWRGEVRIARAGNWSLRAETAAGAARFDYRVNPMADAAPVLTVVLPEGDLDLPAGQQVPLEVLGEDDLGLSELRLEVHKDASAPWTQVSLQRFPDAPREMHVRSRWDVSPLGLLPGEAATFRFALWDDDAVSGRKAAVSPTFVVRFPSLADLYDSVEQRQGGVQRSLEQVAEQARDLQKTLDRLARQSTQQRSTPPSASSFERRSEVQSSLQRQQELSQRITEAAAELRKSLDDAAERQAFNDQLMRKLREMSELMDQIQSPEFRDAMQRLQKALEQMNPRAMEQQLPQWRDASKQLLANLERTLELLKQLRRDEQLESLARRAEELARQQDALDQQHDAPPPRDAAERATESKALAERQKTAAEQSRELAKETRESAQQAGDPEEQKALEEAAQEMSQEAAPMQDQAADAQQGQRRTEARSMGERAQKSLSKAAMSLQQMVAARRQSREGADLAAVRGAAQDLVSLQREVQGTLESGQSPGVRGDRQTDLADGVARVSDSLYALARRSPFITPQLGQALGRAMQSLQESGRGLSSGDRARGEQQGREGSEALNQAVRELRLSENSMCQQPGAGQGGQKSTAERMGELGQRQSDLNQRSRSLAQRLSQQLRLSAGDQAEVRRMAEEQRRLREELEAIQRDEERQHRLLGRLDAAQQEMKEVEEQLQSGPPGDETEQKQTRILSRLLDAQRSLNRRDYDPERESRPGEDIARSSPAPLPADLLREHDRLRLGLLKADADRYPAQYRAFVEAYLRALNEARR